MASKYGSKLGKLGKNWDKAREEFGESTGGFETVPSGNYVIGKLHVELEEDKDSHVRIKREQTISEGPHAGFKVTDRMNLDESVAPRGMEFLLKWLNLLGYTIGSLANDLEETLDAINSNEGATFQATIKENNGFNNVFYNKVIEEGQPAEEEDVEEPAVEKTPAPSKGAIPDIDAMSARKLKKLIQDENLEINDVEDMSEDDLRDAIEKAWKKPKAAKETAKPQPARKATKTSDEDDDDALCKGLFNLGDAFGIEMNKDEDLAGMKKTLGEFTFKKAELDAKEVALLEKAGLKEIIR